MISSVLPLLRVAMPQRAFRGLCQTRIAALDKNIESCNRIADDAGLDFEARRDASEWAIELEDKRARYQSALDTGRKMTAA